MYDESMYVDTVTGFAATLVRQDDPGLMLVEFVERISAVHALIGAAVTVAVDGVLQVSATASSTAAFEQLEPVFPLGPCAEAFVSGETVTYVDLHSEAQRWPEFADAALRAGVLAGASLPLRFAGQLVGALNLYAGDVRSWPVEDLAAARVLADMASVYLSNATRLSSHERRRSTGEHGDAPANPLMAGWSGRAVAAIAVSNIDHDSRRDRMPVFPAGAVIGYQPGDRGVHAIDGDGSSFCGRYAADVLVRLEQTEWSGVSRAHRCGGCQSFMSAFVGSAG